jgi:hypothetical protein
MNDTTIVKSQEESEKDRYMVDLDNVNYDMTILGHRQHSIFGGVGVGGGGDCFTSDSIVSMADGTEKKIIDVQLGEYVFNHDKTSSNKVVFIEKMQSSRWGFLYTPTDKFEPFATINHPLYINGVLSSVDPDSKIYPWLGKMEKLHATKVVKSDKNSSVYNLWLEGDSTYIINGFGTTSIAGDGGFIRKAFEQKLLSYDEASELFNDLCEFSSTRKNFLQGFYILGQIIGKLNSKYINKFLISRLKNRTKNPRLGIYVVVSTVGFINKIFTRK